MNKNEYKLYSELERDHWWFRARREILKDMLSKVEKKNEKSLLDIGCGAGWNMKLLFNSFNIVEGIDNNPEAVFFSKKNFDSKVSLLDANTLLNTKKCYDVLSFLDVLYHQDIQDYKQVLNASKKILNTGGYILIADGAFNILSGNHSEHVQSARRFTKKQLVEDLKDLGYQIITAKYWGFFLFFLIFLKRQIFEKIFFSSIKNSDISKPHTLANIVCYSAIAWERKFFKYWGPPFGSSIFILARKI